MTTQSDLNCELAKLDNLLYDPDFYLEEYCQSIQNEIDLYYEKLLLKSETLQTCMCTRTIQQERERCLSELSKFKEKCRSVLLTTYQPIKEIKEFGTIEISDNLDKLIIQVTSKIEAMKLIIRNFNDCTFDIERGIVVSPI